MNNSPCQDVIVRQPIWHNSCTIELTEWFEQGHTQFECWPSQPSMSHVISKASSQSITQTIIYAPPKTSTHLLITCQNLSNALVFSTQTCLLHCTFSSHPWIFIFSEKPILSLHNTWTHSSFTHPTAITFLPIVCASLFQCKNKNQELISQPIYLFNHITTFCHVYRSNFGLSFFNYYMWGTVYVFTPRNICIYPLFS